MQDKVIPEILSGKKRLCLAITEPTFGSDVKRIATTAVKSADGKHYIVNGAKVTCERLPRVALTVHWLKSITSRHAAEMDH